MAAGPHVDRVDDGRLLRLHPAGRLAKPWLGTLLRPGLSLGTLLGALVIVSAWVLIWVYVRWANSHYDQTVASLRKPEAEK